MRVCITILLHNGYGCKKTALNNIYYINRTNFLISHQFNLTTLKKISRNYSTKLNLITMNTFAFVLLSLAAIATAAPGCGRSGRSPGWCKNHG